MPIYTLHSVTTTPTTSTPKKTTSTTTTTTSTTTEFVTSPEHTTDSEAQVDYDPEIEDVYITTKQIESETTVTPETAKESSGCGDDEDMCDSTSTKVITTTSTAKQPTSTSTTTSTTSTDAPTTVSVTTLTKTSTTTSTSTSTTSSTTTSSTTTTSTTTTTPNTTTSTSAMQSTTTPKKTLATGPCIGPECPTEDCEFDGTPCDTQCDCDSDYELSCECDKKTTTTSTTTTTTTVKETTAQPTTATEWVTVTVCYNITMTTPVACPEGDQSDECVPFACNMCNNFPEIPECAECQFTTKPVETSAPVCDCSKPDCPPSCNCENAENVPTTSTPTTIRYLGPEVPGPDPPGTTAPNLGTAAPLTVRQFFISSKKLLTLKFSTTNPECLTEWADWSECNCEIIPPTQTRSRDCICENCNNDDVIETQACEECEESTTIFLPEHETSMTTTDNVSNPPTDRPVTDDIFNPVSITNESKF